MSIPSELLSQCLDLAKQLITLDQKASINVRLGSDFVFSFNNQENISERKKSPSQIKRNFERKETFKNMKKETIETKENTLEKKPETKDSETQIDILVTSTGRIRTRKMKMTSRKTNKTTKRIRTRKMTMTVVMIKKTSMRTKKFDQRKKKQF